MTLNLPEEVLLLALDDVSGRQVGAYPSYLAAGAALAELVLQEALEPRGEGKKLRFVKSATPPMSHPYTDAVLAAWEEKGLDRKPQRLVTQVGGRRKFLEPLRQVLVDKGILRREQKKALWIFPYTVYPEANPEPEAALKRRLEMAMFNFGTPTARDAVLIALANSAGLLRRNFDKAKLKEHKDRIKEISEGSGPAAEATAQAIEAVKAAILAATIAGSTAATSASVTG
ncbi:GPP34 family phosphoprotein [Parvularcula sp. ZS-1/3]|uniref:GPP34 family phosphoprotein n=1 Tax=Parvularcula mediterranea TaxID=2732508 RepID=A0A7Y3RP83_9PROT|nr:GPP34 family phosphoprotein [Parvularcula mediterranea]NNU17250.1 GPP34 family phosphoprotein [Parvularcula mediterranea]